MAANEMSLAQFADRLGQKAEALARLDLRQAMRQAAVAIRADTLLNFQHSSDPDGNPWLPLKRARANSKGNDKPLLDHGILRAASTSPGPHHQETLTATSLTITNNLDYAAIHNFGGVIHKPTRSRKKPWVFTAPDGRTIFTRKIKAHDITIPQRRFMGFGPRLLGTLDDIFVDFLETRVGAI